MKDIMLADTPVEQREEILRNSCDQILERSYTRKFDQDEINERRSELANVIIQIADLEQELAEVRADYKGKIKPLQERVSKLRDELKVGGDWIKGDCFKFVDEDEGKVGIYSPEGYLLEQRPMTQDERQRNVFRALRTGTEG
jgi:hypothetical protein